ncbi:hypothetical protein [Bifidobacterium gallicum]|uniref:Putative cell surface glycoprotein n=1 Tax=Bifidobacterium gallicum DSM 20093 = LMG 11596 TaxID=561180 RepID=D1NTV2_9BIFI|nr:hypothetical protein [Bifidobacterium gallicum]EFA23156.1 hypothetical protein BIFGAL_03272 [Bifidobacterium gallicum DSM 20093 = LMG 11596]KFI58826.1 putative cell surface glycoprotein [Bifidobacterium gallicum DSM 20093 = LMG 11596]
MKNFFKGLSFSQLFAGALAAVTSFLLSAKIGIAGSVIGVAVGSIVSATASQLYKNVIDESGKKIKKQKTTTIDAPTLDELDAARTQQLPAIGQSESEQSQQPTDSQGTDSQTATRTVTSTTIITPSDSSPIADDTTVLKQEDDSRTRPDTTAERDASQAETAEQNPGQASTQDNQTASEDAVRRARRIKRVGMVVAIVSSLVAVGLTAWLILAFTDGKGTDSVVRDVVTPTQSVTPSEQPQGTLPVTPAPEPTQTPSATPSSPSPSDSPSPTQSPTPSPTSPSPTPTLSDSPTDPVTPSPTPSDSPTPTPSDSPTSPTDDKAADSKSRDSKTGADAARGSQTGDAQGSASGTSAQ